MKNYFSLGLLLTLFCFFDSYSQDPLTNYTWTSVDENSYRVVVTGTDPFGNQSSLLEISPNGGWTGFRFQNVTIDPNKSYRFSFWTKVTSDTPSYTFTGKIETTNGIITSSGSTTNDYYVQTGWAIPGSGTWYLYVGFIKGNGDANSYTGTVNTTAGLVNNVGTNGHRFASGTTSLHFGSNSNSADSSNKIYYFDPRIEEVTGGDDSVTDLLNPSGGGNGNGTSVWNESGTTADYAGEVAIGRSTVPSGYKLAVEGHVRAREVRVDQDTWPDLVFTSEYDLLSLKEVQDFISEHGHLPEIPSAKEAQQNGTDLAKMDRLLLQKVEELTLYILDQEARVEALEKRLEKKKQGEHSNAKTIQKPE